MADFLNFERFLRVPLLMADLTLTRDAAAEFRALQRQVGAVIVASDVSFTPVPGLSSTNLQDVAAELELEKADAAATTAALAGKQPLDATLTALAGVVTAADRLVYATGLDAFAVTPFTAFARTILDDVDAAAVRATIGAGTGTGSVTTVSVVSANGFAGTVLNPGSTPAITLTTTVTGLLKGNGTAMSAAVAGSDYVAPGGALGTPSSGTLTNATGLPEAGVVNLVADLAAKQATLVSGTNIKTVNGGSLLGAGDLVVSAADPSYSPGSITVATETGRIQPRRLKLTGTQRLTVQGTGAFVMVG